MLIVVVVVIVAVVVLVKMQSGKIQTGFPEPSYRPFHFANSQLLFRQTRSCHAINCAKVDKSDYWNKHNNVVALLRRSSYR